MTRPSLHLRAREAIARLKQHLPPTLPPDVSEAIGELRFCIDEMAHEEAATAVEGGLMDHERAAER